MKALANKSRQRSKVRKVETEYYGVLPCRTVVVGLPCNVLISSCHEDMGITHSPQH